MRKILKPAKRGRIPPEVIERAVREVTQARESSKAEKVKRGSALGSAK